MRTHDMDLTSLAWGIVLATITGLLAVVTWTDTTIDLSVVLPAALICAGALVLVATLLSKPRAVPAEPHEEYQS